jgi:gentisate 1,2-dioxygenase
MASNTPPLDGKQTHIAPGQSVPSRDTPHTRAALYYTPPNSFTFSLPRVPCHRFVAERGRAVGAGGTSLIPLDLSQQLDLDTPATTPLMLMRYARIAAGGTLTTTFKASGEIYYVIAGSGQTQSGAERIAWHTGDVFCLPGGFQNVHTAAGEGALLYIATNEPQLAFERAEPPRPGHAAVALVHYPAEELARQLKELCVVRGRKDIAGKAVLLTSQAMQKTRTCFPTLSVGLNIFEPGDSQIPHRHNAAAVTLCISAKPGAHSLIDDARVDWEDNLVLVTPPGAAHGHHNQSDKPMVGLVIQDGGLYYHTRAVGFSFAAKP